MYEAYRAELPSVQGYLHRIGVEDAGAPTKENLQKLITAHVKTVPFENLTIVRDGAVPDLTVEALYRKIVERRRGGWCFELNGLFYALLLALGYDARPIGARVMLRHPQEAGPVDHRATVVRLENREYLADVGFGATLSFYPVPLDGTPTPDGLWVEREGAWLRLYRREQGKSDCCFFCAMPPAKPWISSPLTILWPRRRAVIFARMSSSISARKRGGRDLWATPTRKPAATRWKCRMGICAAC